MSIDMLNVGLLIISLVVAFKIPFQLFLFSYAVLGPLHYITEINWLEGKNYYVKNRSWIWLFAAAALLLAIPIFLRLPYFENTKAPWLGQVQQFSYNWFFAVLFILFLFAIALVYIKNNRTLGIFLVSVVAGTVLANKFDLIKFSYLTMFLPTIIHVYFFTWLFMVYGVIKNTNNVGIISIIVMALCPIVIWQSNIDPASYIVSQEVQETFLKSYFNYEDRNIAMALGAVGEKENFFLYSEIAIKIQIFVAFCYTYHYLNWFSKTTVIGWYKNINRKKLILMTGTWAVSAGLYWYDYKIGFIALFTLSMIHVFFEFPLNIISVQGIFQGLFMRKKTA